MHNTTINVITLDGPSGTGKGTLCHLLAKHLHWHLLDSGAIYRALACAVRNRNIPLDATERVSALATQLDLRFECTADNASAVFLDNEEVTSLLRTESVGQDASEIARIPQVREALLARQRNFYVPPGLVTDGRDMGTVVFPTAVLKIFLYASLEERVQRRYLQLKTQGIHGSLAEVLEELVKRDTRDTQRSHAPLKSAEDAVQVDTTGLTIAQVLQRVLDLVAARGIT